MEFLTAYFANNERTVAKAIYVNDEGNEVPFVVSAEDGNPQWEKILEKLSLDQLHENTYKYIKQSEEDFKAQVMSIAKDRGMLIDIDERNTDAQKRLLDIIFNPDEDEKQRKESCPLYRHDVKHHNGMTQKDETSIVASEKKILKLSCLEAIHIEK